MNAAQAQSQGQNGTKFVIAIIVLHVLGSGILMLIGVSGSQDTEESVSVFQLGLLISMCCLLCYVAWRVLAAEAVLHARQAASFPGAHPSRYRIATPPAQNDHHDVGHAPNSTSKRLAEKGLEMFAPSASGDTANASTIKELKTALSSEMRMKLLYLSERIMGMSSAVEES